MSTLWLLLVPICVAIYSLLQPIAPNDFWYHARAGAEICARQNVPTEALFSSSVTPHTPYFYQSWIAEILLFQILKHGGLSAIQVARAAILVFSFALVLWASWRRAGRAAQSVLPDTTRARIAALSTFLAFALAASNIDVRPQTFSVPLFCIVAWCLFEWPFLEHRRRAPLLIALPFLMLIWANTHGAFFTGVVLLVIFNVGEMMHGLLARHATFRRGFGAALPAETLRAGVLLGALCIAATMVNPRGPKLYLYVWMLAQLQAGQMFIQEWQAPSFSQWYGALFFFALFLLVVLMGVLAAKTLRQRPTIAMTPGDEAQPLGSFGARFSEVAILAALAVMGLRDIRSIIWFALFCAPILAAMSTRLLTNRVRAASAPENIPAENIPRAVQVVNAIIALLLIFSFVPFLPRFKAGLPWPPEYSAHFAPTPRADFPAGFPNDPNLMLERDTPIEAIEFLKRYPPRAKIWNDFVFGSYLVWATLENPRLAPHADPRVEMHDLKFWKEYGRIAAGAPRAASTLQAQDFSDALLDVKEEPKLIRRLKAAGWREMFHRRDAVVLRNFTDR